MTRFGFQGSNSSNLSEISCIGMSFAWEILAIKYSSSVLQSSKRYSAFSDVLNNVKVSLGVISVGNVI